MIMMIYDIFPLGFVRGYSFSVKVSYKSLDLIYVRLFTTPQDHGSNCRICQWQRLRFH